MARLCISQIKNIVILHTNTVQLKPWMVQLNTIRSIVQSLCNIQCIYSLHRNKGSESKLQGMKGGME
jgi:molybdenum cofactor biosynthesis enzyme MoaA